MNTKKYISLAVLFFLILLAIILLNRQSDQTFTPTKLKIADTPQGQIDRLTFNTKNYLTYNNLPNGGVIGYSKNDQNITTVVNDEANNIINITKTPSTIQVSEDGKQAILSFDQSKNHLQISVEDGSTTRVPQDNVAITWNSNNVVRLVDSQGKLYVYEDNSNKGAIDTGLIHGESNAYKLIASAKYYALQYGANDQDYPSSKVMIIDRENGNITNTPITSAFSIEWSPDNAYLVDNVISDDPTESSVLYYNPENNTMKVFTAPYLSSRPLTTLPNNNYLHVSQITGVNVSLWQINVVKPDQAEIAQSFTIEVPSNDYCYYFYYFDNIIYGVSNEEIISVPLSYLIENAQ